MLPSGYGRGQSPLISVARHPPPLRNGIGEPILGRVSTSPRVLLIHNYLSPYRVPLFAALARRFDLDVWILGDIAGLREWREEAPEGAFRWRRLANVGLGARSRYARLLINPTIPLELARAKPDVILCCGWDTPAVFYAAAWAKLRGIPFVLWAGSTPREQSLLRRLTQIPVRWIVRRADGWIAYGSRAKEYLVQLGADGERTVCAFNTVDTEHVRRASNLTEDEKAALRAELGIVDGPTVLYCGNLLTLKGVDVLIRAFAEARETVQDLQLVLVGSGEERGRFESLAQSLGVAEAIAWTGYVAPEQVAKYYAIADTFVLPSRSEVWGLVINEAMAAGVPVIASDAAGAVTDLLRDGENGFTFPTEVVHALASRIEGMFDASTDRAAMGQCASERMNAFTIEAMADAFVEAVEIARRS